MLTLSLDHRLKVPLYEQIYTKIKEMIKAGALRHGDRLPSERSLSANLEVSRNTVSTAYLQLLSEGYIYVKEKSGYYVNKIEESGKRSEVRERFFEAPKEEVHETFRYDFSPSALYTEGFPYLIWERLYKTCLRENGKELFFLGDRQGDLKLRLAIAKYLYEFRGFEANPDNIVIGAGADYLIQLIHQILPASGKIAIENPAYLQAHKIFSSLGRKTLPLTLDEHGLSIDSLKKSEASAVYLTPSHQFPLGIVMPISRRLSISQWAEEKEGRYIIEDDHDSEFRYRGRPIPSMKENDRADKVIYLGTFSRTISPAIRIGFMVLPESLLSTYRKVSGFYASTVPRIEQAVLSEFISGGFYERHINKCKKVYKARHDALLEALKIFSDSVRIFGEHAGVHLVLRLLLPLSEEEVIKRAEAQSVKLYGLSKYIIGEKEKKAYFKKPPEFLLGYGNMSEEDIACGIRLFYESLKEKLL